MYKYSLEQNDDAFTYIHTLLILGLYSHITGFASILDHNCYILRRREDNLFIGESNE